MSAENACASLYFDAEYSVTVQYHDMPRPGPGCVLIQTICSAISSGTEMLAYRGQLPTSIELDTTIKSSQNLVKYPFKYGYCLVGTVIGLGQHVRKDWLGKRVFVFHAHESHFAVNVEELIVIPDSIPTEDAVFLANAETAISLVQDGAPLIGERVLVVGLGIVGLLLSAALDEMPLECLLLIDPIERRRLAHFGGKPTTFGGKPTTVAIAPEEFLESDHLTGDFDLVYEVSGMPSGLDLAIQSVGYSGRLIVGSWYGSKKVELDLGTHFHRSKMSIYASQVSSLDPRLVGRWDKKRRMNVAAELVKRIKPRRLITHQFSINNAAEAYKLLDESKTAIQVIFTY